MYYHNFKKKILTSISILESAKKPHSVSEISKITKSVLAISGMKIGENFCRLPKFLAVKKITDPRPRKLTFLARNVNKF
jgi:hypothetical protein